MENYQIVMWSIAVFGLGWICGWITFNQTFYKRAINQRNEAIKGWGELLLSLMEAKLKKAETKKKGKK